MAMSHQTFSVLAAVAFTSTVLAIARQDIPVSEGTGAFGLPVAIAMAASLTWISAPLRPGPSEAELRWLHSSVEAWPPSAHAHAGMRRDAS
jgi:hypothetical protein